MGLRSPSRPLLPFTEGLTVIPTLMVLSFVVPLAEAAEEVNQKARVERMGRERDKWIDRGVMEGREREWFFVSQWQLEEDTAVMEERESLMAWDCPPVEAAYWLPSREGAGHCWLLGRSFVRYLEDRLYYFDYWPVESDNLRLILEDAKFRVEVWGEILDANAPYRDRLGRRLHLQRLRELIGREQFEKGLLPAALPDAGYNSWWEEGTEEYE